MGSKPVPIKAACVVSSDAGCSISIGSGLTQLTDDSPLPIEIEHPASDETTQAALIGTGFEPIYALVHMRLNLK